MGKEGFAEIPLQEINVPLPKDPRRIVEERREMLMEKYGLTKGGLEGLDPDSSLGHPSDQLSFLIVRGAMAFAAPEDSEERKEFLNSRLAGAFLHQIQPWMEALGHKFDPKEFSF